MTEEVDPDDLDDLTFLAAALTGDRTEAARLVGETLAVTAAGRRPSERPALRARLVEGFLRRRDPSVVTLDDDLPDELAAVAERLSSLRPVERAAVVLTRLVGLPLAEVAGLLDASPRRVGRRLAEAEDRLAADPLRVRAVLETLSWRTPDAGALAAAQFRTERDRRRRRGRVRLLAVALGVVLLAALAVPTVRMWQPLPTRTAGDWVLGLELDPPPGWTTDLHAVTPGQELLQLSSESGRCRAVASLPSAPPEERAEEPVRPERAWVHGRPVQYFEGGVRWSYGDGGDVTLTCTELDRADLLAMAERVRFSTGRSFALPFALARLPAGLQLVGAGYQDQKPVIALSRQRFETFVLVTVAESDPAERLVTLDGMDYRLKADAFSRRLCRPGPSLSVCVEARGNEVAVPQEVARSLRLAPDLQDRSTWFDARDALPD